MNDFDRNDTNDRQIDRNLRTAARHLELPQEPSPLQRARWKQSDLADTTAPKKGILGMKRENIWRVLGAGGALAACVTVAVILGLGGTKQVSAAAIYNSLRESIRKSLWIELNNISDEGVSANGRVLLVFNEENIQQNADANLEADLAASYVELRITADNTVEDFPGLDLEVAAAINADEAQWAFLQTHQFPMNLIGESPFLAFFVPTLNNGVLLDLESLNGGVNSQSNVDFDPQRGTVAKFNFGANQSVEQDDDTTVEKETVVEFSFSTTQEATGEEVAETTADHINEHLHQTMFGTNFRVDSDDPAAQAAIEQHVQMVKNFLTGRFSQEEMNEFINHVESSAEETTVTPNPDGSYLLRATGFDFSGHADADEDLELEIVYWQETGIDSIKLLNLGDGEGVLRFTFSEEDQTSEVFDRTRFSNRPGVRTISDIGDIFSIHGH